MEKYFANFHVSSNFSNFSLINYKNNNYFHIELKEIQNSISFVNADTFLLWYREVIRIMHSTLKNKCELTVNIVFDDNLFNNLSHTVYLNTLKSSGIETNNIDNLEKLFNSRIQALKKSQILEDLVTLQPIWYQTQNNQIIKEYKQIPQNKKFDTLSQYLSVFKTDYSSIEIKHLKDILFSLKSKAKLNVYVKSQITAMDFYASDNETLVVDLNWNYLTLYVVKNGTVLTYEKINKGIANFVNFVSQKYKLDKKCVLNMMRYEALEQDSNAETYPNDKTYQDIIAQYQNFKQQILSYINSYYQTKCLKSAFINKLESLAFSGELAWMIKDLEVAYSEKANFIKLNLVKTNEEDNFTLFALEDKIIEKVTIVTNKLITEINLNNTIASRIDYTHEKSQKTFFTRIFKHLIMRSQK
ncbi:hypothetical protein H9M94_00345 [Mycoplasma sp. Pen4]|uniref:MAG3720 family protein n=1 Tax=Mycoplasma sp. Pen4 TaxID=640330 RepID=UPI0016542AB3|nr:hypothetical protein [Mycoplasma sp. Pen4]QNM93715.1 hypothetical protein H9M94_00345 [Mycoplasma sp. Pen4]